MKTPQLIYLEWYDAISNSDGWKNYNEAINWSQNANWLVQESGFLIEETNDYILLANKIVAETDDSELLLGILKKIPKPWIKKRINLKID